MIRILAPILSFIGGLYFFLEFLLPEEVVVRGAAFKFNKYHQELSTGLALISSFAIGLGVINILLVHGVKIVRSKKNILPSLVLIISFFVTLVVQFQSWIRDEQLKGSWAKLQAISDYVVLDKGINEKDKLQKISENLALVLDVNNIPVGTSNAEYREFILGEVKAIADFRSKAEPAEPTPEKYAVILGKVRSDISSYKKASLIKAHQANEATVLWKIDHLIFYGLFLPLGSSMFSILAFYITYAAFRSFRVRSIESTVMMLAALVVILGQIPQGVMYISNDLPAARLWIMEYISTPAFRSIYFCSSLAGLSLAVRMWFSIDKNPFLEG